MSPYICSHCKESFKSMWCRKKYCSASCKARASNARKNLKTHGIPDHKKLRRQALQDFIYENKKSGCSKCSENRPSCLQYHHVDPSTKKYNISIMVRDVTSLEKLKKELEKCIILCANCHFVEEFGDGYRHPDLPMAISF